MCTFPIILPTPDRPHSDQVPTACRSRTDHKLTTCRPRTDHLTYRLHADRIPTIYRPRYRTHTDHQPATLPTMCRPHTGHIPTTYRPYADHSMLGKMHCGAMPAVNIRASFWISTESTRQEKHDLVTRRRSDHANVHVEPSPSRRTCDEWERDPAQTQIRQQITRTVQSAETSQQGKQDKWH